MNRVIRITAVILIGVLIILEQTLQLNSFVKQAYKVVLIGVIPMLIIYLVKKTTFQKEYNLSNVKLDDLKKPLYFGLVLYGLTIVGYFIFKFIIDTDTLLSGLEDRGIILQTILLASLYLSFVNSFLEEFFFRGFIYQHFSKVSVALGYVVSSALYSLYHVLVMFAIFNWIMGVLAMIGLMIVGMLLVYINRSNKSIINSWIVHIFADLGIVTIAVFLLLTT